MKYTQNDPEPVDEDAVPHPVDENPEEHVGEVMPDPWADLDQLDWPMNEVAN